MYALYNFQNKSYASDNEDLEILEQAYEKLMDENKALNIELTEAQYFSLEQNENALSYFEDNLGVYASSIKEMAEDYFLSKNGVEDNPSVPYAGMEGIMSVNKVKLLNHKWLVADFTDGVYWGEMLYEYFITEQGDLDLELLSSFLYTN